MSGECVAIAERGTAAVLFQHPIRLRILDLAQDPISASGLAGRLRLPRQKVNYHVRTMARAGLLRRAGQRRRRNLVEQRYQATARAFVLAPDLLGAVGAHRRPPQDALSAGALVAALATAQSDVVRGIRVASSPERRLATLSLTSEFRFESAEQRKAFAEALRDAVVSVIDRYTSPAMTGAGLAASGRLHRLVVGSYEVTTESSEETGPFSESVVGECR